MYKIGELSKIVDIPIKTLRYYDECGILHPAQIDNFTGYRFYDDNSILECELIKLLKSVNFTLEEIKQYKENFSKDILVQKQQEIIEEITFLNKKYERLSTMIKEASHTTTPPRVYKKVPVEPTEEKILRRKYERKNIREYL